MSTFAERGWGEVGGGLRASALAWTSLGDATWPTVLNTAGIIIASENIGLKYPIPFQTRKQT